MHKSCLHQRFRVLALATAFITLLWGAGCAEPPQITTYTVNRVSAPVVQAAPGEAWFLKLQGPPEPVLAQAAAFEQLLRSFRFSEDGTPNWDLPTGWEEAAGSNSFRYATLTTTNGEPPLEISISRLSAGDPAGDEYLRSNIDRWRGQLQLAPYSTTDWMQTAMQAGELKPITVDSQPRYLVRLTGTEEKDGQSAPASMLAAIIPRPGAVPASVSIGDRPVAPGTPAALPLEYDPPAEWTATAAGPMQMVRFEVAEGERTLEISISQAGGNLEMNLARWRDQVGLPAASSEELKAALQPIEIDGVAGHYVNLTGEQKTILGAIVPHGGASLFFKVRGDKDLAEREAPRFREFLNSVRFQ